MDKNRVSFVCVLRQAHTCTYMHTHSRIQFADFGWRIPKWTTTAIIIRTRPFHMCILLLTHACIHIVYQLYTDRFMALSVFHLFFKAAISYRNSHMYFIAVWPLSSSTLSSSSSLPLLSFKWKFSDKVLKSFVRHDSLSQFRLAWKPSTTTTTLTSTHHHQTGYTFYSQHNLESNTQFSSAYKQLLRFKITNFCLQFPFASSIFFVHSYSLL